jgi:hypothetical protein
MHLLMAAALIIFGVAGLLLYFFERPALVWGFFGIIAAGLFIDYHKALPVAIHSAGWILLGLMALVLAAGLVALLFDWLSRAWRLLRRALETR